MKKLALKIAVALTAIMPATVLAQGTIPTSTLSSPVTAPGDIVTVLDTVAGWLFTIFFALAIVFLVVAAFFYLTAAGNESRLGTAKSILIYAVIAIVVALIAAGIPVAIQGILG